MVQKDDYIELVEKAQGGHEGSLDELAQLATDRLRTYVYRQTLDSHLAEDIVQESMIEMFRFLDKLEEADRFWPWLRKIASNKLRHHYQRQQNRRTASTSKVRDEGEQFDVLEGMTEVVSQELRQIIFATMKQLKPRYRNVLVLRCYEEMKYSQIASELDCSEFAARRLFYRAKKSLARQLGRRGLGRGSLLMALVVFGKLTAPSKVAAAQISITAATTNVGVAATVAGVMSSKAVVLSLATAGVLSVGTMVITPGIEKEAYSPTNGLVRSVEVAADAGLTDEASEQCWYYYPSKTANSVMVRLMGSDALGRQYCRQLQNEEANYYFDERKNTVYINNSRMWRQDLAVQQLPTDSLDLSKFISNVQGTEVQIAHIRPKGDGLLVIVERDEGEKPSSLMAHHDNILSEDYFRFDWHKGARIVDNRDQMHKRGWTYFRVEGQINGEEVVGSGRIAFVYAAGAEHSPWLKLQIGDELKIVDDGRGAFVYGEDGSVVARYKGGSFFAGLGKQWKGMHTIDTVRRDGAEKQVWFETKILEDGSKAEVVLSNAQNELVYTIDMHADVVEKIAFGGASEGQLRFTYLQDVEDVGYEFAEPGTGSYRRGQLKELRAFWLLQLAEGRFGK